MIRRKPKPPVTFERRGKSYAGYATAIRTVSGSEVIIFAATLDESERIASLTGCCAVDRDLIRRAVLVGEATFDAMQKVVDQSKEPT